MTFVLDNSVTMRWCFGDGSDRDRAYARKVLDMAEESTLMVPAVWGLEVANIIARAERNGLWTESRTREFLEMLNSLDIEVDEETSLRALTDTLEMARRYKLSSYDASYLELASRLNSPLATLDESLRKAAKKAGIPIAN